MLTDQLTAGAIGARTARACDGCMIRRARWFCPSDDAFLCHTCDISVHSANQLASRHERIRISTTTNTSTSKPASVNSTSNITSHWHQKVTRRARTPRNYAAKAKSIESKLSSSLEVPEIGYEEEMSCENDLMVFQVPVLDAKCGFWNEDESASVEELHSLLEFVPDDIQFNDETMNEVVGMDFVCNVELEILDCVEGKKVESRVKTEKEVEAVLACEYDMNLIDSGSRESLLDWDFGFECDEMAVKAEDGVKAKNGDGEEEVAFGKGMLLLKLNCDEVVSAWDELGCPWVNGIRPEFDPLGDGWPQLPDIKDSSSGHGAMEDESGGRSVREGRVMSEERVARVTRYREKRRTRLFSKKIRYEVRKLNAEKRPRMKGRFCKRVQSYVGPQVTSLK